MEIGRWGYTGISWDFGPGGDKVGEAIGKGPGRGRREGWRGVSWEKTKSPPSREFRSIAIY